MTDSAITTLKAGLKQIKAQFSGNQQETRTYQLTEPGAELELTYIVQAHQSEKPELSLVIEHLAPHTKATVLVKTLATDTANPKLNGLLHILPGANGCQSYLTHRSLVFDHAKSWTRPALQIENDDVACSHAATIQTITEHDLFYLRSRGIDPATAKQTLINAFLQ